MAETGKVMVVEEVDVVERCGARTGEGSDMVVTYMDAYGMEQQCIS